MNRRTLLESVIISVAYVLLFISIDYKLDGYEFGNMAHFLIGTGVGILYFAKPLAEKIPIGVVNHIVVRTVGYILLFLGFKSYIDSHVAQFWVLFLMIGTLLYNYYKPIAKRLVPDDSNHNGTP